MTFSKKHLWLYILVMFCLGLAVGAIAKTVQLENDFSSFSPLHLILLFTSGLSMGAIITRLRYEAKIEKLKTQHNL